VSLIALASLLLTGIGLLPAATKAVAGEPTLVFLVRHAEKAKDDPRDPNLSEAGRKRARELARVLSAAGVTHLFSSEFRRTRQTLTPLAEQEGLQVLEISAHDPEKQKATLLDLPPGSVAVVAGHSNTVPGMVRSLGGTIDELLQTEHGEMLHDDQYDRLFLVVLPAGDGEGIRSVEIRYGK
jgi:phosphohistidine phosphatase SixA